WFATAIASAGVLAAVGLRFDLSGVRRATVVVLVALVTGVTLFLVAGSHRGYDWSEQRRASLPPAAALGLRRIRQPLRLDVFLDRDDSRRTQLETDVIAKLYLARPDLVVRTPLDDRTLVAEGQRDADYGRIEVHVGDVTRETRSTSRRELTTLIFEAANMPAPDWSSPSYPGFPFVLEGTRRTLLALLAYLVLPLGLLGTGVLLTQRRVIR
ncbi:MAG TPA: hypothetical protein VFU90_08900, partial [Candidatus Tumulicola sp.]|nr:hypothetical protein [Candidatus Tumulicola sp.]